MGEARQSRDRSTAAASVHTTSAKNGRVVGKLRGKEISEPTAVRARKSVTGRWMSSSVVKKGGQVVMGPQQPRPKIQDQPPAPPPR